MPAGWAPGEDGGASGFDVDLAAAVEPDLLGGGAPVQLGVGGVGELVEHDRVG